MIIGIDPGFSGAIAFLNKNKLIVMDLPLRKIMDRTQINARILTITIQSCLSEISFAAIEDVHSMPEQGIASTFRFGYNAGILLGVLEALNIKVLRVKPAVWKGGLGLDADKKKSLILARKLFPHNSSDFQRFKDDGRAEAALIAYYAQKNFF